MKMAVCYSGNFRTFNDCFDNHYDFFSNISDEVDLYFSVWDSISFSNGLNDPWHILSKNRLPENKEVNEKLILDVVKNRFKIIKIDIENYNDVNFDSFQFKDDNSKNLLYQYYKIKKCFDLIEKEYDAVFRIRTDIKINSKIDKDNFLKTIHNNKILFNEKFWYNSKYDGRLLNEMIWASNQELMKKTTNIFSNFKKIEESIISKNENVFGELVCFKNIELEELKKNIHLFDFKYNVIR